MLKFDRIYFGFHFRNTDGQYSSILYINPAREQNSAIIWKATSTDPNQHITLRQLFFPISNYPAPTLSISSTHSEPRIHITCPYSRFSTQWNIPFSIIIIFNRERHSSWHHDRQKLSIHQQCIKSNKKKRNEFFVLVLFISQSNPNQKEKSQHNYVRNLRN